MDEWIKLSWEGMNWRVRKGYERFIPDKIWDKGKRPEQFPECQILKDNILRTSILVPLSTKGDQKVFLKRHRRRHWKDDLKSLFIPSRAFSEWKTLLHFKRLDLPAPRPIAYGERRKQGILKDSCLITETIYSAQPLNFYVSQQFDSPIKKKEALTKKIELIAQLAQLIAGLHRKGVYYRDLHGGNILCRKNPRGQLELFFVDTDKVRFVSKMNPGKQIRDLAQLYNSIYFGTGTSWVRFLKTYLDEAGNVSFHWKKIFREIEKVARAFRERHIKSRNKRCLKKTTSFAVKIKRKQKLYFRREFSEEIIDQVLDRLKCSKDIDRNERFEKFGGIEISRITFPQNERYSALWVRYYYYNWVERLRSVMGFSPGKLAWFNSNGLMVREIPTPLPLALVEKSGVIGVKTSVLITQDLSYLDRLDDYLRKNLGPKIGKDRFIWKTRFMDSFARYLDQLYKKKVCPVNLKAEEIFVEELGEKSWRFYLGNVNKIIFNHPVAPDKQMRNLVQLHTSIPFEVGWKDRLRFLSGFLRSWPREKRKGFIREVLAKIN